MTNKIKQDWIAEILHEYSGIDKSVFSSISTEQSLQEYKKLIKEFQLIVSILHKGNPGSLKSLTRKYSEGLISKKDLLSNINALIEFGVLYHLLNGVQKSSVDNQEIQEELQHFWRIMGVDSLLQDHNNVRIKRIVGEISEIMDFCTNLERCAHLINERINHHNLRKGKKVVMLSNSKPEANVTIVNQHEVMLQRKNDPVTGIIIHSEQISESELKKLAILFEKLVLKYDLEISLILFDYYLTNIYSGRAKFRIAVWQEFVASSIRYVKAFISGYFEVKLLNLINKELSFRKIYKTRKPVGDFDETDYFHLEMRTKPSDTLVISNLHNSHRKYHNDFKQEDMIDMIKNSNTLTSYKRKYRKVLMDYAKLDNTAIAFVPLGKAKEIKQESITQKKVQKLLEPLISYIESLLPQKKVTISLEAGHIHADRELSYKQIEGMRIGGYVSQILKTKFPEIRVIHEPMIDDDHVVNRIDYAMYKDIASSNKYKFDEIIFESSPLIRQVAIDLYKYIEKTSPSLLEKKGSNIYLKLGNNKFIELLEGIDEECVVGCVLFDAGLCLYRKYKDIINSSVIEQYGDFFKENNSQSIHQIQQGINNKIIDPITRKKEFQTVFDEFLGKKSLSRSYFGYIDRIKQFDKMSNNSEAVILVNVLEGFYNTQQVKLNSLFKLLGIPPDLWTISFNEFGNLHLASISQEIDNK